MHRAQNRDRSVSSFLQRLSHRLQYAVPPKLWTFRYHHLAKSSKFTYRTCTIEVLHLEGRRKPGPSLYPEEENSRGWAVVRTAAGKLVQSCTRNDQGGWKKESELVAGRQWVYEVRILREIWPKPKGRRPGAVKKISGLRPATLNIASKPA